MELPTISVIVPFRNARIYVREFVLQLLQQDYPADRTEILLVSNGSTDGSAEIVKEYPRVRCLKTNDIGPYHARNHGLKYSCGEILAFTDIDCLVSTDWLTQMASCFRDPNVGVALGATAFTGNSWLLDMLEGYENTKAAWVCEQTNASRYFGYANNMGVRRGWLEKAGLFEPLFRGADTVLVQRIVNLGGEGLVVYSPEMLVKHLEISSVTKWTLKRYVYGRSSHFYGKIVPSRPLSVSERREVLNSVWTRYHCGARKRIVVKIALLLGLAAFTAGRLVSRYLGQALTR